MITNLGVGDKFEVMITRTKRSVDTATVTWISERDAKPLPYTEYKVWLVDTNGNTYVATSLNDIFPDIKDARTESWEKVSKRWAHNVTLIRICE